MDKKAIIFDMDGVILDSTPAWHKVDSSVVEYFGGEFDLAVVKKIISKPMSEINKIIIEHHKLNVSPTEFSKVRQQMYNTHFLNAIQLMQGFEKFWSSLTERGVKIALATGTERNELNIIIEKFSLDKYFGNHLYSISDVGEKGKPDPAVYLHAAKQIGVDPEEAVAIEDSHNGIGAAVAAGHFTIGMTGTFDRQDLENSTEADMVVDNFSEIPVSELFA